LPFDIKTTYPCHDDQIVVYLEVAHSDHAPSTQDPEEDDERPGAVERPGLDERAGKDHDGVIEAASRNTIKCCSVDVLVVGPKAYVEARYGK
jgi:hypothetical protein